ncbi:hypothetical protein CJD35_09545 [Sphingobium xenophagum]|uniref:Uncharacterized protein n=1 Tax=Sphingobium xenophagum TaxID=121428 RepID=A0A249MTZ0_SPHXE|nr:hypothetical protein [Sphingobium xenophagum]ASY44665.1 hypothetical protein CJD35_09545 [Sphingobium xenophagum]
MLNLNDPQNWDTPLFPVAVAAQAALVAPATLRQWIVRERVKLWEPEGGMLAAGGVPAEGEGKAALLTLRAVLHISAAARLVSKGVDVADAYGAAMCWAHLGDGVSYWAGEEVPPIERLPLGLYPDPDWTFLIHHAGNDARVARARPTGGTLPFQFSDLFANGGPLYTPPTIVFLNMVDRHARGVCEGYLR